MATTYHIQSWTGVKPQPFLSRLDVKSIKRSRARILGGIPGMKSSEKRHSSLKNTTTNTEKDHIDD